MTSHFLSTNSRDPFDENADAISREQNASEKYGTPNARWCGKRNDTQCAPHKSQAEALKWEEQMPTKREQQLINKMENENELSQGGMKSFD